MTCITFNVRLSTGSKTCFGHLTAIAYLSMSLPPTSREIGDWMRNSSSWRFSTAGHRQRCGFDPAQTRCHATFDGPIPGRETCLGLVEEGEAAPVSRPGRCTTPICRRSSGASSRTTAPRCAASNAIRIGRIAAPAPDNTIGTTAPRCGTSTAILGSTPACSQHGLHVVATTGIALPHHQRYACQRLEWDGIRKLGFGSGREHQHEGLPARGSSTTPSRGSGRTVMPSSQAPDLTISITSERWSRSSIRRWNVRILDSELSYPHG